MLMRKVKKFKSFTAPKIKFSIEYFFSKYDQIRRKLPIWSHLLKKSVISNRKLRIWSHLLKKFDVKKNIFVRVDSPFSFGFSFIKKELERQSESSPQNVLGLNIDVGSFI